MKPLSIAEKKRLILDYERDAAGKLARAVLEKPKPPLWMIFVPVFFVFFAQKMKQYSRGLEDFVDNYLKTRRKALELAVEAVEAGIPADMEIPSNIADHIPDEATIPFQTWMKALVAHYGRLLKSRGENVLALLRDSYPTETDYLLQCNVLNQAENSFNQALLSTIPGDHEDLLFVVDRMIKGLAELRRQEANALFARGDSRG